MERKMDGGGGRRGKEMRNDGKGGGGRECKGGREKK